MPNYGDRANLHRSSAIPMTRLLCWNIRHGGGSRSRRRCLLSVVRLAELFHVRGQPIGIFVNEVGSVFEEVLDRFDMILIMMLLQLSTLFDLVVPFQGVAKSFQVSESLPYVRRTLSRYFALQSAVLPFAPS